MVFSLFWGSGRGISGGHEAKDPQYIKKMKPAERQMKKKVAICMKVCMSKFSFNP